MYVSWNDFNRGGGLFVRYSTDNGVTWTQERQLTTGTPFIRDVQITGDRANGDVYIAGMDEGGGGFPHNDINHIYRSTDGGNTWAHTYNRPPPFPGRALPLWATSRACFPMAAATGGTRVGVSRPPTTRSFTWSMPSTALAQTLATSTTSARPTGGLPLARHSS